MFQKIKVLMELFKYGREVSNKKFWQQQQAIVLPIVVAAIVAILNLLKAYGIQIGIDENTIYWIAGSLYMLVNTGITFATSKHIGIGSTGSPESPTGALPTAGMGEAQPSLPSLPEAPTGPSVAVQPVDTTVPASRFDADTVHRASEWLKRNLQERDTFNVN